MSSLGMQLKKEIMKETGLTAKQLSVRYDGSYRVEVKTLFPLSKVEAIASKKESVQYDEFTQEILCGGNTFVFVRYDFDWKIPEEVKEIILSVRGEISFGPGCNDRAKLYHYSDMLTEKLVDWTQRDIEVLIGHDYKLQQELLNPPIVIQEFVPKTITPGSKDACEIIGDMLD